MRKNYTVLLMFFVLLGIGCTKSNNTTIETEQVETKTRTQNETIVFNGVDYKIVNGILQFASFAQYEEIVNNEDRKILNGFAKSVFESQLLNCYYSSVQESERNQFEFIGKIINADGFIKIDKYLLLIDFTGEKVYAKKDGNPVELLASKDGNPQQNILVFNIQDDVLEELKLDQTRGLFCKDPWQSPFDKPQNGGALPTSLISQQQTGGGTIAMQIFINTSVKYWPAGIYFELNSRVVVTPAGNPLATAPFSYTTTYSCKRRCGKTLSGSSTRSFSNASNDKNIMYWNTRALRHGSTSIISTVNSSASIPFGATRTAQY